MTWCPTLKKLLSQAAIRLRKLRNSNKGFTSPSLREVMQQRMPFIYVPIKIKQDTDCD